MRNLIGHLLLHIIAVCHATHKTLLRLNLVKQTLTYTFAFVALRFFKCRIIRIKLQLRLLARKQIFNS